MQDRELYQQILGLESPWKVERVELNAEHEQIDVYVIHDDAVRWACPKCGRELACYDHSEAREWRHLDTCQFKTVLHARIPRVECPEHGVVQVEVPWAEPRGRFTLLFERFAIDMLKSCQTTQGACRVLRLTWDQAHAIMERGVARGQARKQATPVARIGVDEKAFRRGHKYMTVVCDIDRGVVEHVSDGRTRESLAEYYDSRTPEQLRGIKAVAMDMWEPYLQATREAVPLADAKIVFDRFHVMKHMTEAVDKVRRSEHRVLQRDGDNRLTGTKYLWISSQENLSERRKTQLNSIQVEKLKTGRAWAIKEYLRDLWEHASPQEAKEFFKGWYSWASRCRLKPVQAVARMVKRRLSNIVSYCQHLITNATSEGLNSKIMSLKRRAGGFRNPDNFKTAIYFHCAGLDMYPR